MVLICFLLGAILFCAQAGQASENENDVRSRITDLVIAGDREKVRLVLDVSDPVELSSFVLSAPYRLVIDIHDSEFGLNDDRAQGEPGFLKNIRFGKSPEGNARLILTSTKPFELAESFLVPTGDSGSARIVFDLKETSEINFRLAIARAATIKTLNLSQGKANEIQPKRIEGPDSDATAPARENGRGHIPRIVIDPGHGGRDGGATAVGRPDILEKHQVLEFGLLLASALERRGDIAIKLTRSDDRKVSLARRVEIAREFDADLFISVHADSFPQDRSIRGAAIYTLSERASSQVAAIIAEQENKADFIAGYTLKEALRMSSISSLT